MLKVTVSDSPPTKIPRLRDKFETVNETEEENEIQEISITEGLIEYLIKIWIWISTWGKKNGDLSMGFSSGEVVCVCVFCPVQNIFCQARNFKLQHTHCFYEIPYLLLCFSVIVVLELYSLVQKYSHFLAGPHRALKKMRHPL